MAFNSIFNGSTDSVTIEYERDGKIYSKSISRYLYKDLNIKRNKSVPFKILNGNIGYVNMEALQSKDVPEAMESLYETKAIIFDIRTYPKETLYSITNYISTESHNFYKKILPDLSYPGKFIWKNGERKSCFVG